MGSIFPRPRIVRHSERLSLPELALRQPDTLPASTGYQPRQYIGEIIIQVARTGKTVRRNSITRFLSGQPARAALMVAPLPSGGGRSHRPALPYRSYHHWLQREFTEEIKTATSPLEVSSARKIASSSIPSSVATATQLRRSARYDGLAHSG